MKHKLYNRLLSLALAVGLVVGMLPCAAAVDTVGDTQARNTPSVWSVSFTKKLIVGERTTTLSFKMYDTEGNPLTVASPENLSLSYNGEETEKEYEIQEVLMQQGLDEIETADGEKWIYQNTLFIDDGKIRTINAFGDYDPKVIGSSTVKLYDAVFEVGGFYSRDGSADIRMMYRKASDTESGDVHTEMDLERHKTVTKNPDGTYNLELSVSGAVGNITDPVKLDVMFIVDQSGSMKDELSNGTNRAEAVVNAVRSMTNQLESNQNIDPHYSVVTFSSGINGTEYYNDAIQKLYWTDNAGAAVSAVTINPNGGTNYEAGLLMGRAMLMGSRPNAQKVVIFLSDGMPTYHYENGNTEGGGNSTTSADKNNAYAEAARMTNVNAFYSIRVGSESGADAILQGICDKVHASSVGSADENFKVYSAEKVDELNSVFDQIQGNITQVLCDHVSVEDTLSENVQPVEGASPQVTVTNENGEIVETPNGITASLTGKKLKLSFPEDYKLEKGYEYKVSLTIEPTDLAYQKYSENRLQYPDLADKDTGTHKEQYGFYSNDEATVTYTYNGQTQVNEYPKPVIQLNPGTLIITKQITGDLEDTDITALKDKLTFTVNLNGKESSYTLNQFTPGANNTYSLTIKGLSPVTDYTVTESNATVTGYTLQTTKENDTGTVTKGGSATAQFVNNYKDTKNEYPVRFYLEGIKPGSAKDYPYSDAWAQLNSWLSGGFANVTTSQNPMTNFDSLEGEAGYDDSVSGGSVAGGIAGHTNVVTWLNKYHVAPAIDVNDISAVLTELVKMYPGIANAPVTSVGGKEYTVNEIINNPSDFQIVYTQVTQNHDKLLEYYKGNGSLQQGQDSYHVHLSVRKNPGNLTITKTFSGVESLPSNFAIKVSDSVNAPVDTLTLQEATYNPETKTYTWTLENLNEDTYTVTETGTDVENMVLSATMKVTDEDVQTQETVEDTTAQVKVANNKTSTVDITNTYTPADGYLTIQKEISGTSFGDGRDTFNFKVTATSGKDAGKVWYFTIKGEGLVVEKFKLPVGDYKVEELSNINYKLTNVEGLENDVVTISNSNTETNPATVTFTNTPSKTDIPTDGGGVKNVPGTDNDGKFVWKPEQYGNKGKIEEDPETTE